MTKLLLLAGAALAVAGPIPSAAAQARPQAAQAAVDARTAIAEIRTVLRTNYVVKERRAALDAALAKGLASRRYAVADPQLFAERVNEDLQAVAHDKHLSLRFDPGMAAELAKGGQSDEIEDSPIWKEIARRNNHGVVELKVLEGNVRMMRYDGFVWTGEASAKALDGAMAFLRGGDAIIIDLRSNGGGSPDAVRHIASYFVPSGAKLVTFHMRDEAPKASFAEAEVPGGRIQDTPVYVLTGSRTASAAEEFSSHVAGFGFGTLIGATTAGAGYRNDFFAIPGGFALSVSVGRPELPAGGDWEGKGVAPKIAVAEELALDRALQDVLPRLAGKTEGPGRNEIEWAAAMHAARVTPVAPSLPLAAYAGRYGERTITAGTDGLVFQRDGGLKSALVPLGGDRFALERDPRTRVRFESAGGQVTRLVLERIDGSTVEAARS